MNLYPQILAIAQRFDLDLNMSEASREGLLGDWTEVQIGSGLHDEIEKALDEAKVEYDWKDLGDRGYWIVRSAPVGR